MNKDIEQRAEDMKVKEFTVKESQFNKDSYILIAKTECGKQFVVSGDHHHPTYLRPVEKSVDYDITIKEKW